jgi:aconitate hydratase
MSTTPTTPNADSFKTASTVSAGGKTFRIFSLKKLEAATGKKLSKLPLSIRVLLENLLRYEDGRSVTKADVEAILNWKPTATPDKEIAFRPARVVLQDFTGVPCVVDLATMRESFKAIGGDPKRINPLQPVDLVIDHSVQVDNFGDEAAFGKNVALEYQRNTERYSFLRWGQQAFDNFRVVPPGTGIVHQVNLECLARVVFTRDEGGVTTAYPDTVVGTDSHTTMINGIGVLGWGVGGIEAEAAMLGQPISMLIPQVVGFRMNGRLKEGVTATDLVLRVVEMLRKHKVVGKFVEFCGPGLDALSLADRATIANMAPEYGATMGFFPVDAESLRYLRFTGRDEPQVALVEAYLREQGMFRTPEMPEPEFSSTLELDLASVEPALAGPKRPQDRVNLGAVGKQFMEKDLAAILSGGGGGGEDDAPAAKGGGTATAVKLDTAVKVKLGAANFEISHGSVVIAAITSCTNTSNPAVLMAAGLVAKKARALGLTRKPWVKTSLAPGSQVVMDYLEAAGLAAPLREVGFNLVGFGCTTCIGNSGPLPEPISKAINDNNLVAVSVLSGNRNFEGRISPDIRANYLASPPLVVAYAIAGHISVDLTTQPLGTSNTGKPVYLKDIWPSNVEVQAAISASLKPEMFRKRYSAVFDGGPEWKSLPTPTGDTFSWDPNSTYIRKPTFFENMPAKPRAASDITGARCLAWLGDSVTTDHISPAGSIKKTSPAGKYLSEHGVAFEDFNSYGSRRGNHETMMRGTFANIRLRNKLIPGSEGGVTRLFSDAGDHHLDTTIYEASVAYQNRGTPLVVLAGAEYGTGSSRDWAAKGTLLLGVRAVIAKSFERIHRSNLIGMGVLPLQFKDGESAETLGLLGDETFDLSGIAAATAPGFTVSVTAKRGADAAAKSTAFTALCRIDTPDELSYYRHGGILQYVLRSLKQ